ncbi:MAG: HNH endonuclease [Proteobacteria bacterium]|jgi:hypothetical protein|nr:HNH endonuclease [Pseudomonadota bacterium]
MNKKSKKHLDKKCCFCGETDYSTLDVHRILPGSDGGKYTESNTITCCCKCHRRIHAKEISILGKRFCTNGRYLVHFIEGAKEQFREI